jgi:phage terminase large subunit GpA-like protein
MDALNDPLVEEIVFRKSSQVGWTEMLMNIIGYYIHQDPSPILLIQPTLEMAEAWSKDRFAPTVRDTPVLTERIADPKSRNSGNTILHKTFPGGHLTIAGANSPASLASRPIRVLLFDEIDRYKTSAGTEGSPIRLGMKRTETFWNRKVLYGSTPTIKGASAIDTLFEDTDQRFFHVPCPHCGAFQTLEWANVRWKENDVSTAHYVCPKCRGHITDAHRPDMIKSGQWRASKKFNGKVGFHINALYSPFPGARLSKIVSAFLDAKREGHQSLKVFFNTFIGESFDDEIGESVGDVEFKRETYSAPVPMQAVVLTAGVDVQTDRLEIEVVGWGLGEVSWGIEHKVLYGDTSRLEIWNELDGYLATTWTHESGHELPIACTCVDSGYATQKVYAFCKARIFKKIFAAKGVAGSGRPIVVVSNRKFGATPYLARVGVDEAKSLIYSRLKQSEMCHFPKTYTDEWFKQLTSEKHVIKNVGGLPVRRFILPRGSRNEALDCRVYATAAMYILAPRWKACAAKLGEPITVRDDVTVAQPDNKFIVPQKKSAPSPRTKVRRGGGFVKRW